MTNRPSRVVLGFAALWVVLLAAPAAAQQPYDVDSEIENYRKNTVNRGAADDAPGSLYSCDYSKLKVEVQNEVVTGSEPQCTPQRAGQQFISNCGHAKTTKEVTFSTQVEKSTTWTLSVGVKYSEKATIGLKVGETGLGGEASTEIQLSGSASGTTKTQDTFTDKASVEVQACTDVRVDWFINICSLKQTVAFDLYVHGQAECKIAKSGIIFDSKISIPIGFRKALTGTIVTQSGSTAGIHTTDVQCPACSGKPVETGIGGIVRDGGVILLPGNTGTTPGSHDGGVIVPPRDGGVTVPPASDGGIIIIPGTRDGGVIIPGTRDGGIIIIPGTRDGGVISGKGDGGVALPGTPDGGALACACPVGRLPVSFSYSEGELIFRPGGVAPHEAQGRLWVCVTPNGAAAITANPGAAGAIVAEEGVACLP